MQSSPHAVCAHALSLAPAMLPLLTTVTLPLATPALLPLATPALLPLATPALLPLATPAVLPLPSTPITAGMRPSSNPVRSPHPNESAATQTAD
jgi:hypothetical protein